MTLGRSNVGPHEPVSVRSHVEHGGKNRRGVQGGQSHLPAFATATQDTVEPLTQRKETCGGDRHGGGSQGIVVDLLNRVLFRPFHPEGHDAVQSAKLHVGVDSAAVSGGPDFPVRATPGG
jgi:hypothetical protein